MDDMQFSTLNWLICPWASLSNSIRSLAVWDNFKEILLNKEHLRWKVNNGELVSLWHDIWNEVGELSALFSKIYALMINKNVIVRVMRTLSQDCDSGDKKI